MSDDAADIAESMEMFAAFMRTSHELSAVLKSHLYAEELLARILLNAGPPSSRSKIYGWSFAEKLKRIEAARLLTSAWVSALRGLNDIRNKFAHQRHHALDSDQLRTLNFGWGAGQERNCEEAIKISLQEGLTTVMFYLLANLRSQPGAQPTVAADGPRKRHG